MKDEEDFAKYSCKDCMCFYREEGSDEGICVFNPPQAVVINNEIYSVFPNVDMNKTKCAQIKILKK